MKAYKLLAVMLLVLLAGTQLMSAPRRNPEKMQKFLIKKLNMTEKQEADFRVLADAHHKKMIDLEADARKLGVDMKSMMTDGNLEKDKYFGMETKMTDARNKIHQERTTFFWNVYSMLDAKQKAEFVKLRGKMAERMHAMRGPGRKGFGPHNGMGPRHDKPGRGMDCPEDDCEGPCDKD